MSATTRHEIIGSGTTPEDRLQAMVTALRDTCAGLTPGRTTCMQLSRQVLRDYIEVRSQLAFAGERLGEFTLLLATQWLLIGELRANDELHVCDQQQPALVAWCECVLREVAAARRLHERSVLAGLNPGQVVP